LSEKGGGRKQLGFESVTSAPLGLREEKSQVGIEGIMLHYTERKLRKNLVSTSEASSYMMYSVSLW
jgi:hypothetical protein